MPCHVVGRFPMCDTLLSGCARGSRLGSGCRCVVGTLAAQAKAMISRSRGNSVRRSRSSSRGMWVEPGMNSRARSSVRRTSNSSVSPPTKYGSPQLARHVRAAFEDDDLAVFAPPSRAGRRTGPACDAAHDDQTFVAHAFHSQVMVRSTRSVIREHHL